MFASSNGSDAITTSRLANAGTTRLLTTCRRYRVRPRARTGRSPAGPSQATARSGRDCGPILRADLDLARKRPLGQRNADRQHAAVVPSLDLLGVHAVGQPELPGEGAHDPLPHERLLALRVLLSALGADCQDAAVDRDVNALRVDPGQVEPQLDLALAADGIHPHGSVPAVADPERAVELGEGVERRKQHVCVTFRFALGRWPRLLALVELNLQLKLYIPSKQACKPSGLALRIRRS